MNPKLQPKIEAAKAAINAVFSDTTVSQQDTFDAMHELRNDIDTNIAALADDMEAAEGN